MLGTIRRVGQLLDLFDGDHPEWGVTEVARALRVSKSTAHALLQSLAVIGLLEQVPSGRYRLGWRTLALGNVLLTSSGITRVAKPVMEDLARTSGETVNLAVLERGHVIFVERVPGTGGRFASAVPIGTPLPFHCSAVGKVLLAYRTPLEVRELIRTVSDFDAFTRNTITDKPRFQAELDRVRRQGYALNLMEAFNDVCCLAAPVRNGVGLVVAALGLSMPGHRFERHRDYYVSALLAATRKVSAELGWVAESGGVA